MKSYIHKHLAFDQETWEIIKDYMKENPKLKFTSLVKDVLMKEINLNQTN